VTVSVTSGRLSLGVRGRTNLMNRKRVVSSLILLLVLAAPVIAADDLTGKWVGTLAVTVDATPSAARAAHLVLKQTGTRLTGTLGPNDHDQSTTIKGQLETIRKNGKDVTNVTLDLTPGNGQTALRFAMTFVAGRLKGTAQAISDGHAIAAVLDVTRAK
jgi:hypothetical protein